MKKEKELQGAIEAILFTMGESVELNKIARAIEQDEDTTLELIHKLMKRYEAKDRGIRIIELDHAFQMCTKKEAYEYLIRVARQPKKHVLTDVLLETMSIICLLYTSKYPQTSSCSLSDPPPNSTISSLEKSILSPERKGMTSASIPRHSKRLRKH